MCQASVGKVTENRRVSGVAVSATEGRRRMGRRVAGRALTQQVKAVKKSREKVRIFTTFKNHIKYWNGFEFSRKNTVFKNHRKKSHSTLRANGYILSGQKLIKNAKMDHFGEFFENLKLAVKQCYQTGQFK